MRISIIGQPASGKSRLARAISEKLEIPYLHLDRLYFEGGLHGAKTEKEKEKGREFIRARTQSFIQQESWVSDGWYSRVQPFIVERADVLLFLDIPFFRRLSNHLQRSFFDERHKELGVLDEVLFVGEMVRRMFTHEPKIRAFVSEHADKLVSLRSFKEVDAYLEALAAPLGLKQ